MSVFDSLRSKFSTNNSQIEASVRAAIDGVISSKAKEKTVKYNGAALHVGSLSDEIFVDPESSDDIIVDEIDEQPKSDWLR